jgi:molecular chaperone DnaK (HSP70)
VCYGKTHRYTLKSTTIGDTPAEKKVVGDVVQKFAEDTADAVETFLEVHQYEEIDDLILTGGGTLIPKVRDALCARLSKYAPRGLKVHTHFADGETIPGAKQPHKLPLELVRGATAVGGASVYFDFA